MTTGMLADRRISSALPLDLKQGLPESELLPIRLKYTMLFKPVFSIAETRVLQESSWAL